MKSYILKPKFVRKSEILKKDHILSPARHHKIAINNNFKSLVDLIKISKNSLNISNKKKYFNYVEIGSINNSTGYVNHTNKKSIDISTDSVFSLQKDDILISTVRTYLGGIGIITQNENNVVASKALIVLRDLIDKAVDRCYLFGVLRSGFFIEQTSLILNASMYPRMDKESFNQLKIPFPTKNNNPEPQKIEQLVSLITQNIINKEEQIKAKNQKIDELIERELKENQNPKNSFKYSYPKISEIKQETRLDTGIYEREFKEIDFLIRNYGGGFFSLLSKYTASRGQNLQISNIGESIYSDVEKPNFYRLFTNVELTDDRTISSYRWLGNKNQLMLIPKKTIFLSADGTVGRCIYITDVGKTITNIHPWNINKIKPDNKDFEDVFVAMFLGFLYKKSYYEKIKDKANGGGIKVNHLQKYFPIPNFPEPKQQEIAKEYYFQIDKNQNLTLESYLEKETTRNQQIGIFQLNMEIFELREKLENIIDKIINDSPIEISWSY
jgi:hypothetical protein